MADGFMLDRLLPFLIINRFDADDGASLARRVSTTSPS